MSDFPPPRLPRRPVLKPSEWSPRPIPQPVEPIRTADPPTPRLKELEARERQRASVAVAPGLAWLELAYTHADDRSPMAGAPYRVRFADGSTREGTLDAQGRARLDGLPAALAGTAVDVRFGEPSSEFRPLPVAAEPNPAYRPDVLAALTTPGGPTYAAEGDGAPRLMFASYHPGASGVAAGGGAPRGVARAVAAAPDGPVHEVLEYLWTLVAGAYKQDPTSGEIVGQMVVAMIPVVGQIADVRDLSAYIYQLSKPDVVEEARRAAWIGLVLTGVALLLPEVGAAVAGVGRLALRGGSEAERLALPLLRRVGRGDALRFLERELSAARIEAHAEAALARVAGYLRGFFAAVERTWLPVGAAVRHAAGRALADLGRVAAEGRTAIRQVAAEVAARAKPLLAKIEQEGERAAGSTNAKVEQQAGAEAAGRPPEPEGPGEREPHGSASSRTRSTGTIGGKPTGHVTKIERNVSPEMRRSLERENEAAQTLADKGYKVEQNPPPAPNGKEPDYRVEGEYFDCYSPNTTKSPRGIWSYLKKDKLDAGQAQRFVVNLDDWGGDTEALRQQFKAYSMPGLREVIAVRGGTITHIYP